jgi:ferredoxin-NADP reductase
MTAIPAGQTAAAFRLTDKKRLSHDVATFVFEPTDGPMFDFMPGQYVTLYFTDGQFEWQGKSYSLSNQPGEGRAEITVRKQGRFSGAIHDLSIGDTAKLVGPAGTFYPQADARQIVFLAAGIGIVPFYSILRSMAATAAGGACVADPDDPAGHGPSVTLFYSARTRADAPFLAELEALAGSLPGFRLIPAFTRERSPGPPAERRRIDLAMLRGRDALSPERSYHMCGSISFVNDMWKLLGEAGVPESHLFTEAYY